MRYLYPCVLTPEEEGGFFVAFPDVPGALTSGINRAEALTLARRRSWCRSGWLRSRTLGYSDPEPRRQGSSARCRSSCCRRQAGPLYGNA